MKQPHHLLHNHFSLEFLVTCHTLLGQQVRICGNCPQLGNWDPSKSHRLITDEKTFPIWKSFIPLMITQSFFKQKQSTNVQFKICVYSQKQVKWQIKIPNRIHDIQHSDLLEITFNQQKMVIVPKYLKQIDCIKGTNDIINNLESSSQSSIQFLSNYPLETYFAEPKQQQLKGRRYSQSQLSSNLVSQTGQNQESEFYILTTNENESKTPDHILKVKKQLTFHTQRDLQQVSGKHQRSKSKQVQKAPQQNQQNIKGPIPVLISSSIRQSPWKNLKSKTMTTLGTSTDSKQLVSGFDSKNKMFGEIQQYDQLEQIINNQQSYQENQPYDAKA